MREVSHRASRAAIRQGADSAEIFVARTRTRSLYVDDSRVKNLGEKWDMGMAVRATIGRRIGEASGSLGSPRDADSCARRALEASRLSPLDPVFRGLVEPAQAAGDAPDAWADDLVTVGDEELVSVAEGIVDACERRKGVRVPTGLLRTATVETMVINTLGVETSQRSTMLYLHFTSMTEGDGPGEGVEWFFSPSLGSLEPSEMGISLAEKAVSSASAEHLKGRMEEAVFLPPDQLSEMLASVAFIISAENVHKRRSAWAGKIGDRVASESLTIVEDPFDPRSVLASSHDDEGAPTSERTIVENGVLRGFLYDSYNAGIEGRVGSGNALRRDPADPQGLYQNQLSVAPFNLVIMPGTKRREELLSSYDRALYIERMAHPQVNPLTGGFGLEVRSAHVLERGETVKVVDHALLVGNFFKSLMKVVGIANDTRPQRRCVVPTIGMEGFQLIGSA